MLTKRIIPCLDIDRGRVVKGVSFVDIRDAGDPAELAAFYDREGADELVFLDITASSDSRDIIMDVVKQVSEQVFIPLTVGGGVRSVEDVRGLLEAGADKVSLNTAAVRNPDLVAETSDHFGCQCIVVAMDVKRVDTRADGETPPTPADQSIALDGDSVWEVYTHGGRTPTGSTRSGGPYVPLSSARASCWSPAWTRTGSRRDMTWSCFARYPSRSRCRSSQAVARERRSTSTRPRAKGRPTRYWRPASSTSAS